MTRTPKEQETVNKLLVEAVERYDITHMQAYLAIGADIHQKISASERISMNGSTYSSSGVSPLYHYMLGTYYRENVSDFMLAQGVDVDVKNHKGNTPLMLSVKNGDFGRVKYFLSKGANPLSTNSSGDMVLEEARKLDASYNPDRQRIIDALVTAVATPVAPKPAVSELTETKDDITVMKPLTVGPRKPGGGGLNL